MGERLVTDIGPGGSGPRSLVAPGAADRAGEATRVAFGPTPARRLRAIGAVVYWPPGSLPGHIAPASPGMLLAPSGATQAWQMSAGPLPRERPGR